jgi:hypothetical protein
MYSILKNTLKRNGARYAMFDTEQVERYARGEPDAAALAGVAGIDDRRGIVTPRTRAVTDGKTG